MASRQDQKDQHFTGHHYRALVSSGPLSFLNPTVGYLPVDGTKKPAPTKPTPPEVEQKAQQQRQRGQDIYHVWRSRDNRKGRHSLAVGPASAADESYTAPKPTNTLAATLRGLKRMLVRYPVWDVSYDVAVVFTLGSMVWVINGFFVYLPIVAPNSTFNGESDWGGGLSALVGATAFEFGSALMMLEAVNENRGDCFGWAVQEAVEDGFSELRLSQHPHCYHSHQQKKELLKSPRVVRANSDLNGGSSGGNNNNTETPADSTQTNPNDASKPRKDGGTRKWEWWPSWHELHTHYLRELGFLACLLQMIGATIFWVSGIAGIPPLLDRLKGDGSSHASENGVYWLTQVVGGTGFIVSGFLLMVEVQDRWWKPAPKLLGWHVGLWNMIGGIGFTLCGALGFGSYTSDAVKYASALSTFIGSWAFLIGSVVQWYESLEKYPVSVEVVEHKLGGASTSSA